VIPHVNAVVSRFKVEAEEGREELLETIKMPLKVGMLA
jgi:hypothetical protein